MEKIKIETTQNVDIEYDIASVGDRIVATLIDYLIMGGYTLILVIILTNLRGSSSSWIIFAMIIFYLPLLLYDLLCEVFMNGQSFGKRAMKTRVIRLDGRQPTLGNYLMRWITRIIDRGIIALIAIVINGKGQRLGDMAAGTTVIKLRDKAQISSTAFEKVEEAYVPVFPEAAKLSDHDATTIKQVLRLTIAEAENITQIENMLANKLKAYLKIQSMLNDRQFLQALLKDYNMINGKL